MRVKFIESLSEVEPAAWNALAGAEQPFLRHEFLAALEASGSVGAGTGWQPRHAVGFAGTTLQAAMPLYVKSDSWGEFVFDFAWANAYHQAGMSYYPKLVAAVPFTPATGPRLLTAANGDHDTLARALVDAVRGYAQEHDLSSLHILFPTPAEQALLSDAKLLLRKDCQFHWTNRGYTDFDAFTAELKSAKRKKLRRERRRIAEAGVTFAWLTGHDMTPDRWQQIMPLYASSFLRRGRDPYLNQAFFEQVSTALPEHVLVIQAEFDGEPIACAICFRSNDTLYGRYWGSSGRYHSLHFETCYYQGIEYCIQHGLERFEPGTQGEHKIARGFVPAETWSAHWLSHPGFSNAIDDYIDREQAYTNDYMDAVQNHVPFRKAK